MCNLWKPVSDFDTDMQHLRLSVHRRCSQCTERRKCKNCGVAKSTDDFTTKEWKEAAKQGCRQGCCKQCMTRNQEWKECSECKNSLPSTNFSARMWMRGPEERKCLKCARRENGTWSCIKCKLCKQKTEFSAWLATQKRGHCDQTDSRGSNRN